MSDYIHTGNSLIQAAMEARDKLALTGNDEVSLRKLDDLIKKAAGVGLHGGEQLKLERLLEKLK
ncbi:hypothetical protein ACN99C_11665 [Pseudomonas alloputida]|uniref:hypothetical protein n=1 Tax=Pseudomonas alloputida TaxID=1940621 RepID=UPI003B434437